MATCKSAYQLSTNRAKLYITLRPQTVRAADTNMGEGVDILVRCTNMQEEVNATDASLRNGASCRVAATMQVGYYNATAVTENYFGKSTVDPNYHYHRNLPYRMNAAGEKYMVQVGALPSPAKGLMPRSPNTNALHAWYLP